MKKLMMLLMVIGMLMMCELAMAAGDGETVRQIDLTPIFQAIIALLAALVTYKLIPWLKARTTAQQQALLAGVVRTLVYAAEQIYGAGHGDAKLSYVAEQLELRGYKVDVDVIEAAVLGIKR